MSDRCDVPSAEDLRQIQVCFDRGMELQEEISAVADVDELRGTIERAVTELDAMFPYIGHVVFMSGTGLRPYKSENGTYIVGREDVWGPIDGVEGRHDGFYAIQVDEEDDDREVPDYRIVQSIRLSDVQLELSATVEASLRVYNYLDLHSFPMFDMGLYTEEDDFSSRLDVLFSASEAIKDVIRTCRDPEERDGVISRIIEDTEQRTKLNGESLSVLPGFCYVPDGKPLVNTKPIANNNIIRGKCVGIIPAPVLDKRLVQEGAPIPPSYQPILIAMIPDYWSARKLDLGEEKVVLVPFEDPHLVENI